MTSQTIFNLAIPTVVLPPAGLGLAAATPAQEARGKCRWVRTRGLVCETELGTIGL